MTYSGILAVLALSIAVIIGFVLTNLIMHLPGLARHGVPAVAKPTPHPEPPYECHPSFAAGT
jgi:hypothetical protein